AFFVVMFASTQENRARAEQVSASVRDALEHGQFSNAISMVLGRGKHLNEPKPPHAVQAPSEPRSGDLGAVPHPADLNASLETLAHNLAPELAAGKVGLRLEGRGLVISLREAGFFASGENAVSSAGSATLAKIAGVVNALPNPIRLEGHTDSIPIHNSRFHSNWELSAARAIAMLGVLSTRFGVAEERMAIAGYADTAPADSNETEEGRAHNRRVDLVLLTRQGERSEPPPLTGKP
ncbi:MAG: flagellar motor protein MotB, partial [Bryobacteraceae bacterium]